MSVQLSIINYQNQSIHSLIKNGEIFFRATQLAELLEYQNPHDAIKKHVDNDDLAKCEVIDSLGRKQKVNFVNESGMYSLILGSKQASAKKIKKWVTSEVLPTIRKTGSYSLTISAEQKYLIRKAVNERVHRTGEKHQAIYHKFYDYFKINSYEALPAIKFNEAIDFLGGISQVEDNYDVLARQVGRLEIIYDCQQKLHQIYMNTLEDFIEKLSPSTHYNISTLFNKIHVNLGLSLNYATTAHPTRIVTAQKQLTN